MEEGAGTPPRRSASLHPQIQPSGDSAGASSRRSPCLYPQIQAIEEGAGVTCRRSRGTSRAAAASLPDDDGMLWEILLRLPPQPSSLPRASAVCKRWRCIVGDPKFHRQFYAHHRKSMQSRKLYETINIYRYYPFRSFYTPEPLLVDLMELKC